MVREALQIINIYEKKQINSSTTEGGLSYLEDVMYGVFKISSDFRMNYPNWRVMLKSNNYEDINSMLSFMVKELKIDLDNFKLESSGNSYTLNSFESDLQRTLMLVDDGKCTKNPTQSQVLKFKREFNINKINDK